MSDIKVEAVVYMGEDDKWIGSIDSPDGDVTKKCSKPSPLVQWMHDWGVDRGVDVIIIVWAGVAAERPKEDGQ